MRVIVAVGAYERDNFGDFLFLEVLRRYLPNDMIIPASIIYRDMRENYGIITLPYDFVLRNYKVDSVWVVGGEIGGVDVPMALNMSLEREEAAAYSRLKGKTQNLKESFVWSFQ